VDADQGGGDLLGRLLGEQPAPELAILLLDLDRLEQGGEQPLVVGGAIVLGRRRLDPFDLDPRAASTDSTRGGADRGRQHRDALLAGAAGAAGAVLQRLGVARQLDMDDERQVGQVDAARGDVGRDADPGAAVAQRLQRLVALVLAVLARQRDDAKPRSVRLLEPADIVAGGAEQQRALRLVKPQQVDDRMLDVGRRDRIA
jgi:hypothetical protein